MGRDMQAVLVDITPYTFGTSAEGELDGVHYAHKFIPLIRRNSKLPATRTEVFFTKYEDQEQVDIKVYQGEDPDALENVEIGTFLFSGLNRRRGAYEQGLLFTCSLDLDGLLHVHARERATGREIRGVVENALGRSTDEELGAARERVSALWGEAGAGGDTGAGGEAGTEGAGGAVAGDPAAGDAAAGGAAVAGDSAAAAGGPAAAGDSAAGSSGDPPADAAVPPAAVREIRETLARAERALDAAPAEDREEMLGLMQGLRDALAEGRAGQASDLRRELDEILFYLE